MKIALDFLEDFRKIIFDQLKQEGYQPDVNDDLNELYPKYYNILRRSIEIKPRKVLSSKELKRKKLKKQTKEILNHFKNKIESGENLNPYISKLINNLNFEDNLLNDWGIHHFHMGKKLNDNGFIERTNTLLYAYVKDDCIYLIEVFDHSNFSDNTLIEIIHTNWPEVLEPYRLEGILDIGPSINNQERSELRKTRLTLTTKTKDNTVYAPMGGGVTTAGTSLMASMTCIKIIEYISALEQSVKNNIDQFSSKIKEKTGVDPIDFKFKLYPKESDEHFYAWELNSDIAFKIGPCNPGQLKKLNKI